MPISRKDPPMPAAKRIFVAAAATAFIAGCAGDVRGVLTPVAATAPGTSKVTMLVATTRAADPDAGVLFSGERGKPSFVEMTISLPPDSRRKVGEVQWPSRLPGNPETDFVTLKVDKLDAKTGLARLHERVSRVPKRRVMVFVHGFNNRFEVLPGRVDLRVGYLDDETPFPEKSLRTRAVTLSLNAEAGHIYGIRGQVTWVGQVAQVRIWAVDSADGRRVASVDVPAANVFYEEAGALPAFLND